MEWNWKKVEMDEMEKMKWSGIGMKRNEMGWDGIGMAQNLNGAIQEKLERAGSGRPPALQCLR